MPDIWTDPTVSRLTELYTTTLDSSEIVARILSDETGHHFTRNAVLGKVYRLGLSGKRPKPEPKPEPAPKQEAPQASASLSPRFARAFACHGGPVPMARAAQPLGMPLADLRPNQCRFPIIGQGGGRHLFCGEPMKRGSYCLAHAALCYREGKIEQEEAAA